MATKQKPGAEDDRQEVQCEVLAQGESVGQDGRACQGGRQALDQAEGCCSQSGRQTRDQGEARDEAEEHLTAAGLAMPRPERRGGRPADRLTTTRKAGRDPAEGRRDRPTPCAYPSEEVTRARAPGM